VRSTEGVRMMVKFVLPITAFAIDLLNAKLVSFQEILPGFCIVLSDS
jgi:hypothetical protein